jgi:hypothetical protein
MTLRPEDQLRLERLIDDVCRAQPPLEAPPSLAVRVFEQLEQRRRRPVWRQSFSHWPWSLRAAFLLLTAAVMAVTLDVAPWSGTALVRPLAWLANSGSTLSNLAALPNRVGASLWQEIPSLWLYGALVALLCVYGLLAGVSALAYRSVYGTRRTP